jgi:hypothetical protein
LGHCLRMSRLERRKARVELERYVRLMALVADGLADGVKADVSSAHKRLRPSGEDDEEDVPVAFEAWVLSHVKQLHSAGMGPEAMVELLADFLALPVPTGP